MIAEALILSLDRAIERRPQVSKTIAVCPLRCSVVSAVDGSLLSEAEISKVYQRKLYSPKYIAELRKGEIGCFLSHRKVWKQIAEGAADVAFVVEDDIELRQPDFNSALTFALQHIKAGEYIKFHIADQGSVHRALETDGYHSLIQPTVVPLGTTSQLVTRDAAVRLLESTHQFDRPVDTFLQMFWLTGVPVKVVTPPCVSEISNSIGGSLISGKKSTLTRLRRELFRPWYRLRVAALSHLHQKSS